MDDPRIDTGVALAVRAVADAVPPARADLAGVRARAGARRRRQRVAGAALAGLAAVAAGGVVALGRPGSSPAPVSVAAPAAVAGQPDLVIEDATRVVEVRAGGEVAERWRATGGWQVYGGRVVERPDGRLAVLTARAAATPSGLEVALQVVGPAGAVEAVHPVPVDGDHVALLDATDTEAVLLRQPDGVPGPSRVVVHDLASGAERPVVGGLDQDGATAAAGGTLVHVRPWTCALEVTAVASGEAGPAVDGGCPAGWTASVATPVVSPDGRLAVVAWELRDGPGPVVEGPPPASAVAVTVVDLADGTVRWSAGPFGPDELVPRRLGWVDATTVRLAADGPAAADLPATGEGVAVEPAPAR
jgi:hypothetical protein